MDMRGANGAGKLNQHARPEPAVKRGLVELVDKNNQLYAPDRGTAPAARCGRQTSRSRPHPMTPSFQSFLKLATKTSPAAKRPATKLLYQHLSKKAGNRDLNAYTHANRLWESLISRSPARR